MRAPIVLLSFVVVCLGGCSNNDEAQPGSAPDAAGDAGLDTPTNGDVGSEAADAADAGGEAATVDDLSGMLEPVRAAHSLPSLAGAVFDDTHLIAIGATGRRKSDDPTPITIDDEWHLGSDTKAMTATLTAMIVEEGLLGWDTTLSTAFPGWTIDPGYQTVTLRMLLEHRGGAPSPVPAAIWSDMWTQPFDSLAQRTAAVKAMLAQPPAQAPGTYVYANAGYMIVGAALELATGKSWETMMNERFFGPLSMSSCGFGAPGTPGVVDQPWGHTVSSSGALTPVSPGPDADNPPSMGPAGTVHCSLVDWEKFLVVHLKGARGEPTIVSASSIDTLHTPPAGGDYALGWIVADRSWGGGTVFTHSGSNTMWYATVWIAPATNRIFVAATNRGDDVAANGVDAAFAPMIAKYGGP